MPETYTTLVLGPQSAGDYKEDPLSELAFRWKQSSGPERAEIALSLHEAIVLPICKGKRHSDNAQEGYIALADALDAWNPEIGPFGPFARTVVKRGIRRSWNSLRYPVSIPYNAAQAKARLAKGIEVDSEAKSVAEFFSRLHGNLGEFDATIPDNRESEESATLEAKEFADMVKFHVPEGSLLSVFFGLHGEQLDSREIAKETGLAVSTVYNLISKEIEKLRWDLKYNPDVCYFRK